MSRELLDPRHGPRWDLAGGVGPEGRPGRTLWIASTPRTGSTLLARMLWSTGCCAAPREYVNPVALRDWSMRRAGPVAATALRLVTERRAPVWAVAAAADPGFRARHLDAVWRARTARDGLFALKIHAHHARRWWPDVGSGPGLVVRLTREDRVGQAISWARARQTGRWAAHQVPRGPDRPDPAAVDRRLAAIEADEAWWDATLRERTVVDVCYEALVDDPAGTARRVLRGLGVDAERVRIPPPPSRSQSDGRSAVWRDAWRAAHGQGTDLHRRMR